MPFARSYVSVRPARIILIRHGQSLGNVDESAYVGTPDWRIPLTEKGLAQAAATGSRLKALIGDQPALFFVSPYLRTQQTYDALVRSLNPSQVMSYTQRHSTSRIGHRQGGSPPPSIFLSSLSSALQQGNLQRLR